MTSKSDMENVLFSFGFRECKINPNINFLKISNNNYLIFREFKGETWDLLHCGNCEVENECDFDLDRAKTIQLSFKPKEHVEILRSTIEKLKATSLPK